MKIYEKYLYVLGVTNLYKIEINYPDQKLEDI